MTTLRFLSAGLTLLAVLSSLCLLMYAPSATAHPAASHQHGPLIVAHRGASYDAPENTLAAFRLAWEQGADAIEGDFFLTSDGQILCLHDKDF